MHVQHHREDIPTPAHSPRGEWRHSAESQRKERHTNTLNVSHMSSVPHTCSVVTGDPAISCGITHHMSHMPPFFRIITTQCWPWPCSPHWPYPCFRGNPLVMPHALNMGMVFPPVAPGQQYQWYTHISEIMINIRWSCIVSRISSCISSSFNCITTCKCLDDVLSTCCITAVHSVSNLRHWNSDMTYNRWISCVGAQLNSLLDWACGKYATSHVGSRIFSWASRCSIKSEAATSFH